MDEKTLRHLFTECDVGWVFEGESASERAQQILAEMGDLERHYAKMFGRPLPKPIGELMSSDITRFKPLVQSFASPLTTQMRTMIVCLLRGGQVKAIKFEYELKKRAHLEVDVVTESGEPAHFESDEFWDAEVLRHFGLAKLSGRPFIDGYYAFQKSRS